MFFKAFKFLKPAAFSAVSLALLGAFAPAAHAAVPYAERIGSVFGLPVTNSIITSWVLSLCIILMVRFAVGAKPKLVPGKGQMFVENIVGGVKDLIEPITGKKMVQPMFWLFGGLFTYILIHNWSGMLPGVGTVGMGYVNEAGKTVITQAFVRPANADLNMTMALAAIAMLGWLFYCLKYAGPKVIIKDLFGNKADKSELALPMYLALGGVFILVGFIEIISILLRPITLSFRLFGNVFGGENLLYNIYGIGNWIVPIPFYFLEILVGFVQALVFTLLLAVYVGLICNHEEEH